MIRISPRSFYWLRALVAIPDFLCLELSLLIGYWLWFAFPWHGHYQYFSDFALILWILPPVGIIVFRIVGLYKPEMGILGVQEQGLIFKGVWITYLTIFAISFFYRGVEFARLAVFYSIFLALFLLSIERLLIRRFFEWLTQQGIVVSRALIYGAGHHGQRLERWIQQSPQLGIRVVGYLDDEIHQLVKKPENLPILGGLEDLKKAARSKNIFLLFVAHRGLLESRVIEIFQNCQELGIQCWIIPSLYRFHVERAELQHIGGIPLVSFRQGFGMRFYERVKYFFDFLIAAFLLILTLPLTAAVALGIYATMGPPIFFKQIRVGKGGKKFMMYKFRTLKSGATKDEVSPELQKGRKALNPLAVFLRKSGFDELPQLINVLQRDMSLIGPRPEMPFLVEKYTPLERERLSIRPGITGLWQISRDRKRLLIHENMDYDLYYLEHFGANLDLAIFVKTLVTILGRIIERKKKIESLTRP